MTKEAIAGMALWLAGIGILVLRADQWFNFHAGHFMGAFFAVMTWILGIPIAVSLRLRHRYLRDQGGNR